MNFQVPQFIDVEDKIFGPLTFKQFAYVVGGAGTCFVVFAYVRHLSTVLALILILPIAGFFLALAFQKINGQPMISVLEAAVKYFTSHKLYLWKREPAKAQTPINITKTASPENLPKLSQSKLKDLSWSLDIDKPI